MDIKSWLRKQPQPSHLLCDGKKVAVSTGPRKWADTAETVLSLGTVRLEALADDGTTLRVVELEAGEAAPAEDKGAKPGPDLAGLSKLGELAQLAQIIGNVSDQAAMRHQAAYAMAFAEFAKMNSAVLERLSAMEQSWVLSLNTIAEMRMQLVDAIAEAKHAEQDDSGGMVGQLLGAAMGGALEAPKPNGKANGKGAVKDKKPS